MDAQRLAVNDLGVKVRIAGGPPHVIIENAQRPNLDSQTRYNTPSILAHYRTSAGIHLKNRMSIKRWGYSERTHHKNRRLALSAGSHGYLGGE